MKQKSTIRRKAVKRKTHKLNISAFKSVLLFMGIFVLLQLGFQTCRNTWLDHLVIDKLTVKPAAWLISLFTPLQVNAYGHHIVSSQVVLSVLNGCEGVEGIFMVIAAVSAINSPIKFKIAGILIGTIFMYCLNQLRILTLFFASRSSHELFQFLHGTLEPTLIVVLCCLLIINYISYLRTMR